MDTEESSSVCTIIRGAEVPDSAEVTVVIPAYKPEPVWLEEALESVRAQQFPGCEIIVVDDGSPKPIMPRVVDDLVMVRQPNGGPGSARNRGVQIASGEYVAFLDSDDRWLPGKLERQIRFHHAHPGCVLSCTDVLIRSRSYVNVFSPGDRIGRRNGFIPFEALLYDNCIACSTVMTRRDAYLRAGGMPTDLRLGEDYWLWLRLGMLNQVGYVAECLAEHRWHDDSVTAMSRRNGTWFRFERTVYEGFLNEHPELRGTPAVRAALARLERDVGYYHIERGERSDARAALLRALQHRLVSPRVWMLLARASLPISPRWRRARATLTITPTAG